MSYSMKEKAFENKIKKFLKEEGCWFLKYNPEFFGMAGTPDLLVCCCGYFIAIEVKKEKGKATPLQIEKINQINEAGGIAFVCRPSEFDKLKKIIKEIKNEKSNN